MSNSELILLGFFGAYLIAAFWLSRPQASTHGFWRKLIAATRRRAKIRTRGQLLGTSERNPL